MKTALEDDIQWTQTYLSKILPQGKDLIIKDPLQTDECRWFRAAIVNNIIDVRRCGPGCSIWKARQGRVTHEDMIPHDEFIVSKGIKRKARHLFEVTRDPNNRITFAREYLPHIAAYARLILALGYDQASSSFSLYRTFSRDLNFKKNGGSYETDAEFYDRGGGLYLHVEVKKDSKETEAVVNGLNSTGSLDGLNSTQLKELEYVLDLKPRYLWIVGPGSADPEKYVYSVKVEGLEAKFERMGRLPLAP